MIIVILFFVLKIPFFLAKIIYNLISIKKTREVYDYFSDNHNYDSRPWYLQYLDKGFSFMFTSSEKLKKPNSYTYYTKKKMFNFPLKWYFLLQFRRIFLLQKYLFVNLLFHILLVLFHKRYLKLYYYSFWTLIRFIFGDFVIRDWDERKKKIIYIFTILIKKQFEEDPVLRQIKQDYDFKAKLKKIIKKLYKKVKFFVLLHTKTIIIFFLEYIFKYLFVIYLKIIYCIKVLYIIYNTFIKYFVKEKKKTPKKKDDMKRSLLFLFIYKPDVFKFHIKDSTDLDLNKKWLNVLINTKNVKLDSKIKKTNKKLFENDLILKYKIHKLRFSINFLNAKNLSIKAFSNIKTYWNWFVYKYKFIEKIVFKKLMSQFIWTKEKEFGFSLDVDWDIFLLGNNVFSDFLKNLNLLWEEPDLEEADELLERVLFWSFINMPYHDFIESFLKKTRLTSFINRHVLKTTRWLKSFDYDFLIYINKNFIDKDIIALLYDNYYYYLVWTYENYNYTNKNLKKRILNYLNSDLESMKFDWNILQNILDIQDYYNEFVDSKVKQQQNIRFKIKTIIKEDLLKASAYYENDFFMFRWVKFIGLKWFDLQLYDEKIFKISKTISKKLISSDFYLNNIWLDSFNLKLSKKLESNIIYKILEKKNGLMPFFFSNINLKKKWFIWSFSMSERFDWISKKKKPLKFFKKLKKAKKEKRLHIFSFFYKIWKFIFFKDIKLKNLKSLKYVLEEWKRIIILINQTQTKTHKNKNPIFIKFKEIEILDFVKVGFSRDLIYYIYTMYKYNKLKGLFKVLIDIIVLILILIIKKIIEYIKKS